MLHNLWMDVAQCGTLFEFWGGPNQGPEMHNRRPSKQLGSQEPSTCPKQLDVLFQISQAGLLQYCCQVKNPISLHSASARACQTKPQAASTHQKNIHCLADLDSSISALSSSIGPALSASLGP